MRVLRVLLAGLIAVFALLGVLFAAVVVIFTGLAAYMMQLFRRRPGTVRSGFESTVNHAPDDAIDVVTTKVTDDPAGR